MDNIIEMIVQNNPTLDGAKNITMTITREDMTRAHYYILKNPIFTDGKLSIPQYIFTKENGKGRNKHYIVVAVTDDEYYVYDLNKEKKALINGKYILIGECDEHLPL